MKIPNFVEICKKIKIDESRMLEVKILASKFNINIHKYEFVSSRCENFPTDLLFALHIREDGGRFDCALHNGEKIIGTGKKTKLVPAGRGPFPTWEEAAIDAIMMDKNSFAFNWDLPSKLEFAEKYNGLGYRKHDILSPYVFAGTNFSDEIGKYTQDGNYSSSAKEEQLGVAAIILGLNK